MYEDANISMKKRKCNGARRTLEPYYIALAICELWRLGRGFPVAVAAIDKDSSLFPVLEPGVKVNVNVSRLKNSRGNWVD